MADFKTHLYGAAAASGVAALGIYSLGWTTRGHTLTLFLLGVAGGLLPDIDAPKSTPIRVFFTLLGVLLAFAMTFPFVGRYPLSVLAGLWLLIFVTVRLGIFALFSRYTVHRGIWHSWLAAIAAGLAGAAIAHRVSGLPAWESWLGGAFVTLGYFTHLLLDEIASVNLLGKRIRRSLGTALKPLSLAYPGASVAMLLAVLALGAISPPLAPVLAVADHYGLKTTGIGNGLHAARAWLDAWTWRQAASGWHRLLTHQAIVTSPDR
jgi:hypothetical protein